MTVQTISVEMPIGKIVLDYPETRSLLDTLRIDYPCSGGLSLSQAAQAAGIDPESVLLQINWMVRSPADPVFSKMSPADLCCYLVSVHHAALKRQLPDIKCLLCKVRQASHKSYVATLKRLAEVFDGLCANLDLHMLREEQDLFPQIAGLEAFAAGRSQHPADAAQIATAISQLTRVHSASAESLSTIRDLTEDFSWPDPADGSFASLYERLSELEDDLHEHIHLENNLLFPRALALNASIDLD